MRLAGASAEVAEISDAPRSDAHLDAIILAARPRRRRCGCASSTFKEEAHQHQQRRGLAGSLADGAQHPRAWHLVNRVLDLVTKKPSNYLYVISQKICLLTGC